MNKSITQTANAAGSPDDLGHQIDALRADLAKLVETLSDDTVEGISKAGQQLSQSGRDARDTATKTVLDHPLASVGIAAAVGLLLGLSMRKG
jgi:ElaB/YqjD/DUF883 family membrane-anchored ribosome-binding protein